MRLYLAHLLDNILPEIGVLIYLAFHAQFQHRNICPAVLLDRHPIHRGSKVFGIVDSIGFHKRLEFS